MEVIIKASALTNKMNVGVNKHPPERAIRTGIMAFCNYFF